MKKLSNLNHNPKKKNELLQENWTLLRNLFCIGDSPGKDNLFGDQIFQKIHLSAKNIYYLLYYVYSHHTAVAAAANLMSLSI